jgi:hypothetical protein
MDMDNRLSEISYKLPPFWQFLFLIIQLHYEPVISGVRKDYPHAGISYIYCGAPAAIHSLSAVNCCSVSCSA